VAMIHGLLVGNLATWYFTAAPALARTRRVLLYDLRGHGRSERVASGYDLGTMAGDLDALTARFDDRPFDLVGHSYGALVALRFALDHPDRVGRLALVDAPLPLSSFREVEDFAGRTPAEMAAALPEGLRALVAGGGRRASMFLASLHFLAAESSLFADLRAEPDITDEMLARVGCPVLCVYGERSSCRAAGERLSRVLPRARLQILPGGHFLHLDAPGELTAALAEFLDS
jgi:pimeloyl-ACP methyl ester carboxylesterase